ACAAGCIACRRCEKECPEGAIRMENELAVIDYDKCTGCGRCVEVCPTRCIHAGDFRGASKRRSRA
ncbi:MAG TPA: 4Fe-4S binding protein, partial [Clostridia bacterium]|nr:4Fe-4S binding protein [Clostridia bacterium]